MKIIQLTDLHIPAEGEDSHGVDVRRNFRLLLEKIPAEHADLLVISGDLCIYEGNTSTYEWIREQLRNLAIPQIFLSGNHDDPVLLAETLGSSNDLHNGELFGRHEIYGHALLFLDSSPGQMSDTQYNWLQSQLASPDHPRLIFIHHPPVEAGLPFMDINHPFREQGKLQSILQEAVNPLYIFCGHYHTECTIQQKEFSVYITPSCYFQIDRNFKEFQVESRRIGFRWIEWDGQVLRTAVRYFEGHSL